MFTLIVALLLSSPLAAPADVQLDHLRFEQARARSNIAHIFDRLMAEQERDAKLTNEIGRLSAPVVQGD